MENIVTSLFSSMETKYIIIIVAILLVAFVLALIKKVIKLGIILLIAAMVFGYGGTTIASIKDTYGIEIQDSNISIGKGENKINIDLNKISKVKVMDGTKENEIGIELLIGDSIKQLYVPNYIYNILIKPIELKGNIVIEDVRGEL